MQAIKIFLASSINEFEKERLEIHSFIQDVEKLLRRKKNDFSLKLVKCENIDNDIVAGGKQSEYDEEIKNSDIVMFLFGNRAGEYTIHELEEAAEFFGENKEKISVMCMERPNKSEDETLKNLDKVLNKYCIEYRLFSGIVDVKNEILMKLIILL